MVHEADPKEDELALWPVLGEYRVYDEVLYYIMSHDEIRNQAYRRAIARLAPGRVALDIGTGQDVNWARACVEAGARKVYAIDELAASFELARETISDLGLEDRIELIHGSSLTARLPEKVDLCVSEIIGGIGGSEGAAVVLADARRRFLAPGGAMIPARCETRIAAVELPSPFHDDPAFGPSQAGYVEQIFANVGHPFDVKLGLARLPATAILSTDDVFEDLAFETDALEPRQARTVSLQITRPGRLDGLALWIRLWCAPELEPIDSLRQRTNWIPTFFPLFHPGVAVSEGDELTVTCDVRPSDDGVLPDYRASGSLRRAGAATPFAFDASHHGTAFRQNAMYERLFPRG
jgi:type I protein arginine methyltransferase